MTTSIDALRTLLATSTVQALVCDLDGVLRRFDPSLWNHLADRLELPPREVYRAILGSPHLQEVVRGRSTHERWRQVAREDLVARGAEEGEAARAVQDWARTPARIDEEVRSLLLASREHGRTVIVLTNGTDRVRQEALDLGLEDVIGGEAQFLLSSHEVGHAKPEPEIYAAAHRRLEEIRGSALEPGQVAFLDDSQKNIAAAADFGWRAVHHPSDG